MTRDQVDAWNAAHPVGSIVDFAHDDGMSLRTWTTGPAMWRDGAAVVSVDGLGEVELARCAAVSR